MLNNQLNQIFKSSCFSLQLLSNTKSFHSPPSLHQWKFSVEKETELVKKIPSARDIINEDTINEFLLSTRHAAKDPQKVESILQAAKDRAFLKQFKSDEELQTEFIQGLTLEETATLLNVDETNHQLMQKLFKTALEVKQRIYGNRIVLFTPLYVSNHCVGSCLYCGYRGENKDIPRTSLNTEELVAEVKGIEGMGHKRVMMLTGESPKYSFEQFLDAVKVVSKVKDGNGEIRRVNVEIPQLSISDFKRLKATDAVGTYVLFQETYHRKTFKKMHPYGNKGKYEERLLTMDRAMLSGVDDVGIGALFGLYDYRFEVMALLQHAQHLDKTYGAG